MREERVSVLNALGERLVGVVTFPLEDRESYPAVLLVHGFGVTKEEGGMFDSLAHRLAINGFLVCRFDFSGRGESAGDYKDTSLLKQRDDLSAMLAFLKQQACVDTSRIGLHAQSFGTAVSLALVPDVQALILMGSIAHATVMSAPEANWSLLDKQGVSIKKKPSGEVIKIGSQFWPSLETVDFLEQVKKVTCPVLFIHGGADDRIPLSEMEALFAAAHEPKQKTVIDGADHGLRPHREVMYQTSADWFKKHLSPP